MLALVQVGDVYKQMWEVLYLEMLAWTSTSTCTSCPDVVAALYAPTTVWRVVLEDGVPLGVVAADKINLVDRTAEPVISLLPQFRRTGKAMGVASFSLDQLMRKELNLRRAYSIVVETSLSVSMLVKLGFELEGRLKGHRWQGDKYVDVLVYGMDL